MSRKKDWDYIARLEKAISEKYGSEAIQNPSSNWDDEKEKEYLKQIKKIAIKDTLVNEQEEMVEIDGFLVSKKLLNKDGNTNCPVCISYLKTIKDDIYIAKYECCENCFIQYIENREDRWKKGWRPKNEDYKVEA